MAKKQTTPQTEPKKIKINCIIFFDNNGWVTHVDDYISGNRIETNVPQGQYAYKVEKEIVV